MKNNKGFSLVELIVVIAIMAILAAIAIPTFAHFIKKSNEASDAELLDNINYILNLSCLDNGVDIRDVTYAEWDKEDKCVINVRVTGASTAKTTAIETSFVKHFGEVKKQEFKYIENITFNPTLHKFVEGESVYAGIQFTDEQLAAIKDSIYYQLGTEVLLDRLGIGTNILTGLGLSGNEWATQILGVDSYAALARLLGYTSTEDPDFQEEWKGMIATKKAMLKKVHGNTYDDEELTNMAMTEMLANTAVLVASTQQNSYDQDAFVAMLAEKSTAAKDTIKYNLASDIPAEVSAGTSQSALVYGLYTAYAARANIEVTEDFSVRFVLDVLNPEKNEGFRDYIASEYRTKDLNAYNSATSMIASCTGNRDAVKDVVMNGFNNSGLSSALNSALK